MRTSNWECRRTTTTRRPETPPSKARPAPRAQAPAQECRSPPEGGGAKEARKGGSPGGQRGRSPQAVPTGHDRTPLEMATSRTGHTANPRRDERDGVTFPPAAAGEPPTSAQDAQGAPDRTATGGDRAGATGPRTPSRPAGDQTKPHGRAAQETKSGIAGRLHRATKARFQRAEGAACRCGQTMPRAADRRVGNTTNRHGDPAPARCRSKRNDRPTCWVGKTSMQGGPDNSQKNYSLNAVFSAKCSEAPIRPKNISLKTSI